MNKYILTGSVLPERALLSTGMKLEFSHSNTGYTGSAEVSIIQNQIIAYIKTQFKWNIYDLRNTVKTMLLNHIGMIGYLSGLAYEIEITRIVNNELGIDYVFGVDIPCLVERNKEKDLNAEIQRLQQLVIGEDGIFLHRSFTDLNLSMKHADDTAFYCYRAIESLRLHFVASNTFQNLNESDQWEKFRQYADVNKETIMHIKNCSDPLRHGGITHTSDDDRKKIFLDTWDIVDSYINKLKS
jgi:hypothetical protein